MEKRKIRYGIIGFGLFAERAIAPAIQASPNSTLVAIQKRSPETAREKARTLSIPHAFSTASELVSCPDVDAVFIASANSAHHDETIAAARAGKHVLVEKPMAMNAPEALHMVRECEHNNVKLMVGHVVRFSPMVRHLRKLIESGELGRVISARADYAYDARLSKRSWLFDRAVAGGGPVFDIGVHCLDTLCHVLNAQVQSVQSQLSPLPTSTTTERTAILNLALSTGALATIACSFEGPTRNIFIEVIGTEGLARAYDFTLSEFRTTLEVVRRIEGSAPVKELREFDAPNLYTEEVTSFSQCILDDKESPVPGIAGWRNQQVLDAAMNGGGKISHS